MSDTGIILKDFVEDGRVELTDLVDIDNALAGKVLGGVVNSLYVDNPQHDRNKRLAAFINRPNVSDKIAAGEFQTPKEMIQAIEKSERYKLKKGVGAGGNKDSRVELPFVFVTRDPAIRFDDEFNKSRYSTVSKVYEGENQTGNVIGALDLAHFMLTYTVRIIGWNDNEVSQIATHLMMWAIQQDAKHNFTYKSAIASTPFESKAQLINLSTLSFENESVDLNEGKLRVLSGQFNVSASVLRMR